MLKVFHATNLIFTLHNAPSSFTFFAQLAEFKEINFREKLFVRLCCEWKKSITLWTGDRAVLKLTPTKARLSVNRESWMESLSEESGGWPWQPNKANTITSCFHVIPFVSLITITRWALVGDPTAVISYTKAALFKSNITIITSRMFETSKQASDRASLVAMHAWTLSSQQLAWFLRAHLFMTCLDSRALIDAGVWVVWRSVRIETWKIPWTRLDSPVVRKWNRVQGTTASNSFSLFTRKPPLSMNSPLRAALDALLARVSRWMFPCVGFCREEKKKWKVLWFELVKFFISNLLLFVQKK